MRRLRLSLETVAASLALAVVAIAPATSAPLDAPACEQLQARLDMLRSEGAAADMARGPEWARANLPPDRLQRIGTLLDVEEQLNFRCGLAKARIVLPTTIEGGEEEIPAPGEAPAEGAPKNIVLPQKAPTPRRPAAAAAAVTATPKAPPPKAAAPKAPATKPAAKKEQVKAVAPRKGPEKAVQPAADGAEPKKKAPAKIKKKQPQVDDAYRPPRPVTSEGSQAPVTGQ
jgi:outer membrane biosynthesis protein TonB